MRMSARNGNIRLEECIIIQDPLENSKNGTGLGDSVEKSS